MRNTIVVTLIALVLVVAAPRAQERTRVGLLPFDVASVEGGTQQAATSMAKLVRAQMITSKTLQPVLIDLPEGASLPLSEDQLAALATDNNVQLLVAGTILDATVTTGSNRISTGGLGGALGSSIGGSMRKSRAEVQLHVEMSGASGQVTQAFEVEGNNTDMGLGADVWSALGSFDLGEGSWDKSPMGKALREAAEQLVVEVQKRRRK